MNVGVTGATGFIGRHLVASLRAAGHRVVALVRDASGRRDLDDRYLDLADPRGLDDAVGGLDAVVHAAAFVPRSYSDPTDARTCLEVNALGSLAMLRACVAAAVPHFVLLSGNVYRLGAEPVREDGPIEPVGHASYYLVSKACADFYASHFLAAGRLAVTILRPSAVFGPGLRRGMIATFVEKLDGGERVAIEDGGRYRADLVYVTDVAEAAVAALAHRALGPFNIGAGVTASALQVAETIARILGARRDLLDVRPPLSTTPSGFSPLDVTRARRELAYAPHDLEAGLRKYIAWWRQKAG